MAVTRASESYIQVATDGTGQKVRNLKQTTLVDGVETIVQSQVVALAGPAGGLISDGSSFQEQMLAKLDEINDNLTLIADAVKRGS